MTSTDDELVTRVARVLCWKNGCDPDTSLGGDKQNWLWMEYEEQARAAIALIVEEAAKVADGYWSTDGWRVAKAIRALIKEKE